MCQRLSKKIVEQPKQRKFYLVECVVEEVPVLFDHVARLLPDHNHGGVRVACQIESHDQCDHKYIAFCKKEKKTRQKTLGVVR